MMQVRFLPSDGVTSTSGQDSQQQITQGLTKINQHETVLTNIKAVIWITKYKQYKITFQSYVLLQIILISRTSSGIFSWLDSSSLSNNKF
jgi:hypothetical protein